MISSCSDHSIKSYSDEFPKIVLREFFNGKIYALGIVQNRSGKVIKRFKVDIRAYWEGNTGYLDEKFIYSIWSNRIQNEAVIYKCDLSVVNIDGFKSENSDELATQASIGRSFQLKS